MSYEVMIKLLFMRLDDTLKVIDTSGARDHYVVYNGDYMIRHESLLRDINGRGPSISLHAIGRILPYGVSQAPDKNSTLEFGTGENKVSVPSLINNVLNDELDRMLMANFWHKKLRAEGAFTRFLRWISSHFLIFLVVVAAIIILVILTTGGI